MANPNLPNRRALQDANLTATTLIPAANTSANSASIDLQNGDTQGSPYSASEQYVAQIDIDALPNATSVTNSYTIVLQDSEDNVTFANIPELGTTVIPGVADGPVSSLATFGGLDQYKLPPTTRRYLRAQAIGSAGIGNNIGQNFYLSLRF